MAWRNTALQSASRWMKQPVQYNMLNGMTSRSLHNNRSVQNVTSLWTIGYFPLGGSAGKSSSIGYDTSLSELLQSTSTKGDSASTIIRSMEKKEDVENEEDDDVPFFMKDEYTMDATTENTLMNVETTIPSFFAYMEPGKPFLQTAVQRISVLDIATRAKAASDSTFHADSVMKKRKKKMNKHKHRKRLRKNRMKTKK